MKQELWNEEIQSIKQRILNELGVVQETKMDDRQPLNKINIKKQRPRQIDRPMGSVTKKFALTLQNVMKYFMQLQRL